MGIFYINKRKALFVIALVVWAVEQFRQTLTLYAGMSGRISDAIYSYPGNPRTGYEYIEAALYQENGEHIPVILTFDQGYDMTVLPSEEVVHSTHDKYVPVRQTQDPAQCKALSCFELGC